MTTITLKVPAISCGHCVHTIKSELGELPGVKLVNASEQTKLVTIGFEPPATQAQIESTLAEINYPAEKLVSL
ncbi:MAG: heavy-metal-associated domain-containing protein [Anaerolineales bacterium]|nr:heavy-metal-associated domain-containing protein [Anaerolineales bacterium]